MVKVWAEKEMRNYRRIHAAGIPCPAPIFLRSHVLLMEFLGTNGWPSPRLKDAGLSEKHMREAYVQTILILRHMYQRCRLIHGDLSEYNLLWHKSQIYVIDVSQSVETDHPAALDFLRKDISNVNDYFKKFGKLNVMTNRQLFEFVTTVITNNNTTNNDDETNGTEEEAEIAYLDKAMEDVELSRKALSQQTVQERREHEQRDAVDEAVFMNSFLPRSLNQVADYDVRQIEKGEVEATYAHAVAALTGNQDVVDLYKTYQRGDGLTESEPNPTDDDVSPIVRDEGEDEKVDDDNDDDDDDDDQDSDDDETESETEEKYVKVPKTPEELEAAKAEIREQRKANKKSVREAKADKRQSKIKKKDKKRAIKKAKAGNRKNK